MKPENIAMDFFSKLDNERHAEFKTTYSNGLQRKSVKVPKNLNKTFTLVNRYLKLKVVTRAGGVDSTFATTADTIERKPGEGKGKRQRQRGKSECLPTSIVY